MQPSWLPQSKNAPQRVVTHRAQFHEDNSHWDPSNRPIFNFPSSIRSVGPQMSDHPFKNGRVNLRRTTPKNRETRPVIALSPSRDRKMVSPSASGAASFHSRSFSPGGLRGAGINVMDSLSLLVPKLSAEPAAEALMEAGLFGRERERTYGRSFTSRRGASKSLRHPSGHSVSWRRPPYFRSRPRNDP